MQLIRLYSYQLQQLSCFCERSVFDIGQSHFSYSVPPPNPKAISSESPCCMGGCPPRVSLARELLIRDSSRSRPSLQSASQAIPSQPRTQRTREPVSQLSD